MKKLVYIPAAAGILAFGGVVLANTNTTEPANSSNQNIESAVKDQNTGESLLTFEEISAKALQIADGTITDIELDKGHRRTHYDVDVDFEGYEYDLELDAYSGEVLKQNKEKDDDDDDEDSNLKDVSKQDLIGFEEAIDAAMKKAGNGTFEKAELEHDDGAVYYDIEITDGQVEHEVAVDAYDGSIIEYESDQDDDDDDDDDDNDDD